MKLKQLLLIKELWTPGNLTSGDDELIPYHPDHSSIHDGKDWFIHNSLNDWVNKKAYAAVYITENDKPMRIWIEVKTKWLKKPNDTHAMVTERVRKHIEKVSRGWAGIAKRIRKEGIMTEIGNHKEIPWSQCFEQALQSPQVSPFIQRWNRDNEYQLRHLPAAAPIEHPKNPDTIAPELGRGMYAWENKKKEPMVDPVNFTLRK